MLDEQDDEVIGGLLEVSLETSMMLLCSHGAGLLLLVMSQLRPLVLHAFAVFARISRAHRP